MPGRAGLALAALCLLLVGCGPGQVPVATVDAVTPQGRSRAVVSVTVTNSTHEAARPLCRAETTGPVRAQGEASFNDALSPGGSGELDIPVEVSDGASKGLTAANVEVVCRSG